MTAQQAHGLAWPFLPLSLSLTHSLAVCDRRESDQPPMVRLAPKSVNDEGLATEHTALCSEKAPAVPTTTPPSEAPSATKPSPAVVETTDPTTAAAAAAAAAAATAVVAAAAAGPPDQTAPLPEVELADEPTPKILSTWEEVERRKREIEAANKRRQQLLKKTLASRQTQVISEAQKLKQLQAELNQLEKDLSFDINLIRGRIETSAREYETAKKRFDHAEQEYVTAKLQLHRTQDMKEQLTEHLMLIIQKLEERKAEKLEAMLQQLHMPDVDGEAPTSASDPQPDSTPMSTLTPDPDSAAPTSAEDNAPVSSQTATLEEAPSSHHQEAKPN
ncbi:uncharacterized protein MONBRDRAFT_28333 [Monosiga brevicollis MX1]|uniref:RAB6-interacting golgin n=1 Tax=Monosiga brevicollis TaxID=81824 RepID=A9V7V5_MONBE|nr:uncharacterized protein MONBRDRAFT_28333 [Monosiga brevicollis MX1]EDQ86442.1 predicted protein [Monosiga brevicollis MX1]|eukprot:XP_001748832.1 hypothetical protein [Monosiga brevicollis MX1]